MTKNMFKYAQYVIWYIATYCNIFCITTYYNITNMSKIMIDPHILFYILIYILCIYICNIICNAFY